VACKINRLTRNTQNKIAFLLAASIFLGVSYVVYKGWRQLEDNGYLSCLASIQNEIHKSDFVKDLVSSDGQWKILTAEQVDLLMSKIQPYDCGKYKNPAIDLWGNRIQVALRKPADKIEIFVWSKGHNGISSTEDDLVIPWGEKPPQ
jgi:hypothetical protein